MKRLLMLSLLLSVAALQAILPGEYNPAMRRHHGTAGPTTAAGPTTSGTIAADGSVVSGDTSGATTSGTITSDGDVVSGVVTRVKGSALRARTKTSVSSNAATHKASKSKLGRAGAKRPKAKVRSIRQK